MTRKKLLVSVAVLALLAFSIFVLPLIPIYHSKEKIYTGNPDIKLIVEEKYYIDGGRSFWINYDIAESVPHQIRQYVNAYNNVSSEEYELVDDYKNAFINHFIRDLYEFEKTLM